MGGLSNYPAGVTNADPHFHQDGATDVCPDCGGGVNDTPFCPWCDAPLDLEEAAAIEREDAAAVRDSLPTNQRRSAWAD